MVSTTSIGACAGGGHFLALMFRFLARMTLSVALYCLHNANYEIRIRRLMLFSTIKYNCCNIEPHDARRADAVKKDNPVQLRKRWQHP
jgi:hypothetical protein